MTWEEKDENIDERVCFTTPGREVTTPVQLLGRAANC